MSTQESEWQILCICGESIKEKSIAYVSTLYQIWNVVIFVARKREYKKETKLPSLPVARGGNISLVKL